MASTHAFWLRALLHHAAERGLARAASLGRLGLREEEIADPFAPIALADLYDALEHVAAALRDPDLGLHLGRDMTEEQLDAMAFVSSTAATLREGIAAFVGFLPAGGERFTLHEEGNLARVTFRPWGPRRPAHHHREASFVADLVIHRDALTRGEITGLAAHLVTRDDARLDALREALGVPVRGGARVAELRFDRECLALPGASAHPEMNRFFSRFLAERTPDPDDGLTSRLSSAIDGRLPDGPFDLPSLSRGLGVSARTLQRRLQEEGQSLRTLLRERRLARAAAVLAAGRSHEEAAFEAGYSEASALHRALRNARQASEAQREDR